MTPGTAKRGKAMKTAVEMFERDKENTLREKELMKSNLHKVRLGLKRIIKLNFFLTLFLFFKGFGWKKLTWQSENLSAKSKQTQKTCKVTHHDHLF